MPPPPRLPLTVLDAGAFLRWAALARSSFASARAEIDALNVFPVPDGDTGTNLYLTLDAALDATRSALAGLGFGGLADLAAMCRETSRAMLLTARGNSGVILSQLFRGMAEHVHVSGSGTLDAAGLAAALHRADEHAWKAVTDPRMGTILSVSRATAQAAKAAAGGVGATLGSVVRAAVDAAHEALAATPDQLPVLARAGVVDAGGAGYVLLLEALHRVVSGEDGEAESDPFHRRAGWTRAEAFHEGHPSSATERPTRPPVTGAEGDDDHEPAGPAYEVMYLLSDTEPDRVEVLRRRLAGLGDSLLVVGGEDTWNVHVHVDDPGAAIEAGIEAGRPHRISVTHFGDQIAHLGHHPSDPDAPAVVACAPGPGLAEVFRAAGAQVLNSGPGDRASAGRILDAIRATGARTVLVLPNDGDTRLAAATAAAVAAESGIAATVIDSTTAVHGIAALAVLDPAEDVTTMKTAMTDAIAATRHGAVSVASKEADTPVGVCRPGDVLGFLEGAIAVIGCDLPAVAAEVALALLADGGELLTLVSGSDAPDDLAGHVAEVARARHPDLEVSVIEGGQPLYPLLVGVE